MASRNLRYAPVVASFREKYIHNEVLFSLVDKVTRSLGGESWQNLMRNYILGVGLLNVHSMVVSLMKISMRNIFFLRNSLIDRK